MPGSLGRVAQKDAPGNPARCRITCTFANTARHISPKQLRSSVSLARSCSASLLGEFASCSASLLGICSGELAAWPRTFGRLLPTSGFVAFAHSLDDGWYRRPSRASRRRSFPSVISPHPCLVRDLSGVRAWSDRGPGRVPGPGPLVSPSINHDVRNAALAARLERAAELGARRSG